MGNYCQDCASQNALPEQIDKNGFIKQCWDLLLKHEQLSFISPQKQGEILSQLQKMPYNRQKSSFISVGEDNSRWIMLKHDVFLYVGESLNSQMHGKGAISFSKNKILIGDFSKNRVEGEGELHFTTTNTSSPKQIKLSGKWASQVVGQLTISDETLPFTASKQMIMDREGCTYIRYPNFDEYIGETSQGLAHGEGKYIYRNGHRQRQYPTYEGSFKEGLREGRGAMHYNSSMQLHIRWTSGKPQGSGVLYLDNTPHSVMYRGGRRVQFVVSEVGV